MKSCWWILCTLVLFLSVGCVGEGEDIPGDGSAPATEELTEEEETAERELGNTRAENNTGGDPGNP